MRKTYLVLSIVMLNAIFITFMLLSGSKYPLNLMTEDEAYTKLVQMQGVGEIKAKRILEERNSISDVKTLDTRDIKYSRYFVIRGWNMRTDVMYIMFGASLIIQSIGVIWLCIVGVNIHINKYIVFDDKGIKNK